MQNIKCTPEIIALTRSSSTPICLWPKQESQINNENGRQEEINLKACPQKKDLVVHNKVVHDFVSCLYAAYGLLFNIC